MTKNPEVIFSYIKDIIFPAQNVHKPSSCELAEDILDEHNIVNVL